MANTKPTLAWATYTVARLLDEALGGEFAARLNDPQQFKVEGSIGLLTIADFDAEELRETHLVPCAKSLADTLKAYGPKAFGALPLPEGGADGWLVQRLSGVQVRGVVQWMPPEFHDEHDDGQPIDPPIEIPERNMLRFDVLVSR